MDGSYSGFASTEQQGLHPAEHVLREPRNAIDTRLISILWATLLNAYDKSRESLRKIY